MTHQCSEKQSSEQLGSEQQGLAQQDLVKSLFVQQFASAAELVCHAPGRVNLIGDHTDYNDGFVFPAAINFGTTIAAAKREDAVVNVYAHDCDQQSNEFNLSEVAFDSQMMWSNYVKGTLLALMKTYPEIKGANLVVTGNVPQGAGLSSSASFEIAILKTFAELYQLDLDGIKAALMGQKAENNFVGCNCGIMDQLISAMGQKNHAMLLDCKDLSFEDAPIPSNLALFIVNSNVKRGLVDSEYNLRREQCEQVAQHFGKSALREVSIEQLNAAKEQLEPVLFRRARHVISENARAVATLTALKNNDIASISVAMKESHNSLRDDFQVTTKEMDGLVEIIDGVIGNAGGVRMTGGGFGGCVVALVPRAMVEELTDVVNTAYPQQFGLEPSIYLCTATQGAFR
ncbi:galactokinase [Thalassotalea sp. ND16A]|uniref:galactokinase n=1 Tax=Thalassotalea sp. ND16A TaxID=1535422 RepID=UPI00051DDDA1|nr:galactokinase [Thalassotalea sp. ND16A]KGJ92455.1 Galactokinase [Thalassotalea sp. ND16A]